MGYALSRVLLTFFRPVALLGGAALLAGTLAVSAKASEDPGLAAIGGEGVGSISGFIISDIDFALDNDHPGQLSSVSLAVIAPDGRTTPRVVAISLQTGQPTSSCHSADGLHWSCPVSWPLAAAEALRVIATG
ncbi:MAG: hypothetical protein MUO35_10080 [Anaerolineales bacterium]|nr:hypothetical protein [Anaerolineales bacterium]